MSKYYYLVATLPYLQFGEQAPVSTEAFMEECGKWLSEDDLKIIADAAQYGRNSKEGSSVLLDGWKRFDLVVREEIALFRESRKKGGDFRAREELKQIVSQKTPLEMEKSLEKMRWDYLADKELSFLFDINSLILYFLKLQILERIDSFDKDKGERFFYNICEVNYEQE